MAAVPSEELRTVLWKFVILLTANFQFRNRSTCSKGPVKRASKVFRDSQDLKSPGSSLYHICKENHENTSYSVCHENINRRYRLESFSELSFKIAWRERIWRPKFSNNYKNQC